MLWKGTKIKKKIFCFFLDQKSTLGLLNHRGNKYISTSSQSLNHLEKGRFPPPPSHPAPTHSLPKLSLFEVIENKLRKVFSKGKLLHKISFQNFTLLASPIMKQDLLWITNYHFLIVHTPISLHFVTPLAHQPPSSSPNFTYYDLLL